MKIHNQTKEFKFSSRTSDGGVASTFVLLVDGEALEGRLNIHSNVFFFTFHMQHHSQEFQGTTSP